MPGKNFKKAMHYAVCSLPLLGMAVAEFSPVSTRMQQFFVLIVLVWFQVFMTFEVFLGNDQ